MSEVRVCENCNHVNGINNLECEKCGFDLSFVIPVDESELQKEKPITEENKTISEEKADKNNLKLVSPDGALTIRIVNEMVIGRDGENGEYFEKSNFVSRKHAIFYIEDEVMIFDASTNGTFVNNKRLPKCIKTPIHSGDTITFADLTFEVHNAD